MNRGKREERGERESRSDREGGEKEIFHRVSPSDFNYHPAREKA